MRICRFIVTGWVQMFTQVQRRMLARSSQTETGTRNLACCSNRRLRMRSGIMAAGLMAVIAIGAGDAEQARSQALTTIHTFTGNDGSMPTASVIRDAEGNIYGTTLQGGSMGWGTVFKIDSAGHETVLHNFAFSDGAFPWAGLIRDAAGNLYGTTVDGGPFNFGTVFKVDSSGKETVLHSFNCTDGASPFGALIRDSAGNFYGTTEEGGSSCHGTTTLGNGTVFKLDRSGKETVLFSFTGSGEVFPDGSLPVATLVRDSTGNLYGTTEEGGAMGFGTVFKLDTSGNETVLHSFNSLDGAVPAAGLVRDAAGNLYGTTLEGGSSARGGGIGFGTVFKLDTAGSETVLHNFDFGAGDGIFPEASLIVDSEHNLLGTTQQGGASGQGTVFKIDPSNKETVVHSFSFTDRGGFSPTGGLIMDRADHLYGTATDEHGPSTHQGTVFRIALAVPFSAFTTKLEVVSGRLNGFELKGYFTQGAGAQTINLSNQDLTLSVGSFVATIPAGSFHKTGKGASVFEGMAGGKMLEIQLEQTGANSYLIRVDALNVNLNTHTNTIPVTLTVGYNSGTTQAKVK